MNYINLETKIFAAKQFWNGFNHCLEMFKRDAGRSLRIYRNGEVMATYNRGLSILNDGERLTYELEVQMLQQKNLELTQGYNQIREIANEKANVQIMFLIVVI